MQTLDDAWNNQDWGTFEKRHKHDTPTHGIERHREEGVQMFKTLPDNRVENRPYKVFFASGDWTCSIARLHGTIKGPMVLADESAGRRSAARKSARRSCWSSAIPTS